MIVQRRMTPKEGTAKHKLSVSTLKFVKNSLRLTFTPSSTFAHLLIAIKHFVLIKNSIKLNIKNDEKSEHKIIRGCCVFVMKLKACRATVWWEAGFILIVKNKAESFWLQPKQQCTSFEVELCGRLAVSMT